MVKRFAKLLLLWFEYPEWLSWFNHHRLLEPIGYIPPAEAEANYYQQLVQKAAVEVLM